MFTRTDSEKLISEEQAFAKVINCPLEDDTNIKFIVNQLLNPQYYRPIKKLDPNANRNWKYDTQSRQWFNRIVNRQRGLPKATIYTKKTSVSLLPEDGVMHLFHYNCGIILLFDMQQCLFSETFVFPKNVVTNDRWWIWGNSTRIPESSITIGIHDGIIVNKEGRKGYLIMTKFSHF